MCVVCSYFKRQLDTMNRYNYITKAYQSMATWMMQGNDATKKLKRYIHRNLKLPPTLRGIDADDTTDVLHHFAWHYVDALLTYCSDNIKPGKLTFYSTPHACSDTLITLTPFTQAITSCAPRRRASFGQSPSERFVSTHPMHHYTV